MLTRMRSLEQLMPFATAGELLMQKRRSLVVIAPGTTAVAALREMEKKDIAFLPVVEGGKLVGVIAERDIARGVILHSRTLVRDIMTTTSTWRRKLRCGLPGACTASHPPLPVMARSESPAASVRYFMGSRIARHGACSQADDERVTCYFLTEQL